jgi:hypothetical protein
MNLFFHSFNPFLIISLVTALSVICIIFLLTLNFTFVYAQLNTLGRPITSKVVPSNFSSTPSNAPIYQVIPITSKVVPSNFSSTPSNAPIYQVIPITSKVVPYKFSATPLAISPSYTVTNATITFADEIISGLVKKYFSVSIVNSSDIMITGSVKKEFTHSVVTPTIKTIKGEQR